MTSINDIDTTSSAASTEAAPILTAPNYIPKLKDIGVIVVVEISLPSFSITDSETTDELTTKKRAAKNAAKVTKKLMADCPEFDAVVNKRSEVMSTWLKKLTFDYMTGGRFLLNPKIEQFSTEVKQHHAEFTQLQDSFLNIYDDIISKQAFLASQGDGQGEMFKREDYPTRAEVARKFGFRVCMHEVPTGNFCDMVASSAVEDAVRDLQKQAADYVRAMEERQINDMREIIGKLINATQIDTVVAEDGTIKVKRGRLFETTFRTALDICDTMQASNITNNPVLSELSRDIQAALSGLTVEAIRESDTKRITVNEDLQAIKNKFSF